MTTWIWRGAVALLLGAIAALLLLISQRPVATTAQQQTAPAAPAAATAMPTIDKPQTFEYMTIAPPDGVLDLTLNKLGAASWELVSMRRATDDLGHPAYEMTLKRVRREGQTPMTSNTAMIEALKDYQRLHASSATTATAGAQ